MNSLGDLPHTSCVGHIFKPARVATLVYFTLVALIIGWAAFQRFRLPPWPLSDPDTWGYLNPALAKLTGGSFQHSGARNFVYPGFLLLVLATCKSFGAITIVQHTLGLLTGGLLLGCWHQLLKFNKTGSVGEQIHRVAGLFLLAIYLLSSQPITAEHELRPEAITPVFAVLDILLALKFIEQYYLRREQRRSYWLGAAIVVVSFLLLSLKPSFGLTGFFATLPILVALFRRKTAWVERVIILAATAISALLLVLPEYCLAKSDPFQKSFLPSTLFFIHANLIADQMDEDIARGDCGERGCEWLVGIKSELREEIRRSWELNQSYQSLRVDPDYLMYSSTVIQHWKEKYFQRDTPQQLHFYWHYARRAIMKQPAQMLAKICRQMRLFYSAQNHTFDTAREIVLREPYSRTFEVLQKPWFHLTFSRFLPAEKYKVSCAGLGSAYWAVPQARLIRRCNTALARNYSPIFCAVLLASGLLFCSKKLRLAMGMLWPATLLIYSYNFGACLETAFIHSLENSRYLTVQFSFTLLAEFAGVYFLSQLAFVGRAMASGQIAAPRLIMAR
jgi:hypothetical protein